nr:protein translocase subunit SecD [Pseudalkalibacillus caeni]
MVKKGRIVTFFIIVIALASLIAFTIKDITSDIKLGLDLQGGFEVLYDVEPAQEGQEINKELLNSTVSALYERINVLGVSEPSVTIEGNDRIRVQLAGVKDQNQARDILSTQAELSFRTTDDKKQMDGTDLKEGASKVVFEKNQPVVQVTLKHPEEFANITRKIKDMPFPENRLVIWLDYEKGDSYKEELKKPEGERKFISDPQVTQVLSQNQVIITGPPFKVEEAQNLADLLNAGSLPVKLKEIYSTSVGAQFGEQALDKTVVAGYIGIGLIFLFMMLYYRFPGVIAVITLSVYIYLILLVFDWMNAVLTLPGIAALVLGVGMAVDANIITYERIKEEIRTGKSMLSAFKAGSRRSFATILDANITTVIAGGVLFIYGTSAVKGFAVMLITSILVSFITAVWGSRLLLGLWVKSRALNKKPGYFGVKESEIDEL